MSAAFCKIKPNWYTDTTSSGGGGGGDVTIKPKSPPGSIPMYNALNFMPEEVTVYSTYFRTVASNKDLNVLDSVQSGDIVGIPGKHYVYVESINRGAGWSHKTVKEKAMLVSTSQVLQKYGLYKNNVTLYDTFYKSGALFYTSSRNSLCLYRLKPAISVKVKTSDNAQVAKVSFNGSDGDVVVKNLRWGKDKISLNAISDGQIKNGKIYKFTNWTGGVLNNIYSDVKKDKSFSKDMVSDQTSVTITANYDIGYEITLHNSMTGIEETGTMAVDDGQSTQTVNLPLAEPIIAEEKDNLTLTAMAPTVINGIRYTFDHWSYYNSSSREITFTPGGPMTLTAYYKGTPTEVSGLRCTSGTGQHIALAWNAHPNPNCTYQVWRHSKNSNTNFTATEKIADNLSHYTTTFVDGLYKKTSGYTNYLLVYDVRSYYPVEQTTAPADFRLSIFGNIDFWNVASDSASNAKAFEEQAEKKEGVTVYPNPFNPETQIRLNLRNGNDIAIDLYDVCGAKIERFANGYLPGGEYTFRWNGSSFASGIYFLRIKTGNQVAIKRLILMK